MGITKGLKMFKKAQKDKAMTRRAAAAEKAKLHKTPLLGICTDPEVMANQQRQSLENDLYDNMESPLERVARLTRLEKLRLAMVEADLIFDGGECDTLHHSRVEHTFEPKAVDDNGFQTNCRPECDFKPAATGVFFNPDGFFVKDAHNVPNSSEAFCTDEEYSHWRPISVEELFSAASSESGSFEE